MGDAADDCTDDGILFGRMRVIATDQNCGRRYRCACGWTGWTVWGRARKHAKTCPRASEEPRCPAKTR